jgi:hypothetical protein
MVRPKNANNCKIDPLMISKELTPDQCDIAIAVWRKYGVFKTYSSQAELLGDKFKEETIWKETFCNIKPLTEKLSNKLYRLTTQIMDYYTREFNHIGVARISIRGKVRTQAGMVWDNYNLICKPTKSVALGMWDRRTGSAATNMLKAHQQAEKLGRKAIQTILHKAASKLPLAERLPFLSAALKELVSEQDNVQQLVAMVNAQALPPAKPNQAKSEDVDNGNVQDENSDAEEEIDKTGGNEK